MHNIFAKPLDVIKQWPSMGPIASQRLFNTFLTNRSTLKDLKKLVDFFEKYETCSLCQTPLTDSNCQNCMALKHAKKILIVPHILDFLLLCEDFWQQECALILLNGYVSPLYQQSPDSTGLNRALQSIENPDVPIHILFNRSLEARGTLWIIKGLLPKSTPLYDESELLGSKESLFVLSAKELESYKMQLQLKFSS